MSVSAIREVLPACLQDLQIAVVPGIDFPTEADARGVLWASRADEFWFELPDTARYLVEAGQRLSVAPSAGASAFDVLHYLGTTPVAVALLHRGISVLHASAVVDPRTGQAQLFAGDSAAGKSVLATALLQQGWQLLADDHAAVEVEGGRIRVLPTEISTRLWPADATALGVEGALRRAGAAAELGAVWLLRLSNETETAGPLAPKGWGRLRALQALSFNSRITTAVMDRGRQFQNLAAIAESPIPIRVLRRARSGWSVDDLVKAVLAGGESSAVSSAAAAPS